MRKRQSVCLAQPPRAVPWAAPQALLAAGSPRR